MTANAHKTIAKVTVDCSTFGPTSLERSAQLANVLEELSRRLRINSQLGDDGVLEITEDGRHVGSFRYEEPWG
jgi:hypothetical protein